jgi:hypothetical protein
MFWMDSQPVTTYSNKMPKNSDFFTGASLFN